MGYFLTCKEKKITPNHGLNMHQNLRNSSKKSPKSEVFYDFKMKSNPNVLDLKKNYNLLITSADGLDMHGLIDYAKAKGLEMIPKTHKTTIVLYSFLCDQLKNTDNLYHKQETILKKFEEKTGVTFTRFSLSRANKELKKLNLCMIVQSGLNRPNGYLPNIHLFVEEFKALKMKHEKSI